jgi:hypothetical protein
MRKLLLAAALLLSPIAAEAQAAASHGDQALLSADPTFQNRVKESLAASCVAIANEGFAVVNHKKRADYCAGVLAAPDSFKVIFAVTVATDTNVIADATASGTLPLTPANAAAQGALVSDAHIDAAISSEFNAFLLLP